MPPPLLEREPQLEELRAARTSAAAGEGRLTLVEGRAGTGKSSLLAQAAAEAGADEMRVLRARGSELERDLGFGAIRQLFESVILDAAPARREELLGGAAAFAGPIVAPGLVAEEGPASQSSFAGLHAVYWLAAQLSQAEPLVLVVDDAHWVDGSSIRALSYLAGRVADLPIAIVVALRPDEPGTEERLLDELRAQPGASRIVVAALGREAADTLVAAVLPDADSDVRAACFAASAGNPFYLRELLLALAERTAPDGLAALARETPMAALGDRLLRRIEPIGHDAAALTRALAVLDDGARLVDAAALSGIPEEDAAAIAARLQRIDVLATDDPARFSHPLVRRGVYDGLSATDRDTAHRTAADLLRERGAPTPAVVAHLAAMRPSGSPAAASALRDAATDAAARGASEAAARWLTRALAERAAEPKPAVLLHELGRVELDARAPEAVEHLRAALELSSDPVHAVRVALELMEILHAAGRWNEALSVREQVLGRLGEVDAELASEGEAICAVMSVYDPRLAAEFERDRPRLMRVAEGESWGARALAALLANIAVARGDDLPGARRLATHAAAGGRLFDRRGAGGWASAQLLHGLILLEEDARALQVGDRLAAEAGRRGVLIGTLTAIGYGAWRHARAGELPEAEVELQMGIEVSVQNGMPLLMATAATFLQDSIAERVSLPELVGLLETLEIPDDIARMCAGAMLLEARGRLHLARDRRDAGIADLRACGATFDGLRFSPAATGWRSALALALPTESREEALVLADDELEQARMTGLSRPLGVALRAAGLLHASPTGLALLSESVEVLRRSPWRLEFARSQVAMGAALRRSGERARARAPLAAGLELAHRCGAERLVAVAGDELRATGARPRRIMLTGVEALTASEQRTARLVAGGRSNAEVAQELFVSLKTVETHLSHAYAKLGLSGTGARRELPARLLADNE